MSATYPATPVGAPPRLTYGVSVPLSRAQIEAHDPEGGRGGVNRRWLCPLPACAGHQNPRLHRSLSLHEEGRWHCHRCGGAGFVTDAPRDSQASRHPRLLRSLSVASALPRVPTAADRARWEEKVGPVRRLDSPGSRAGREYLVRRGFRESDLPRLDAAGVRFGPQFYGRPALLFSLRQRPGGAILAVQGRLIAPRPDGPKMLTASAFEDGSHGGLFLTPSALDPGASRIVVTEAPLDAASLLVLGVPAIATCGAKNFPPALRRACTLRKVVAAYDADQAGDEAAEALETIALSVGATFERWRPESGKDFSELLGRDRAGLAAFLKERLPAPEPAGHITRPLAQSALPGAPARFASTTTPRRQREALPPDLQAAHRYPGPEAGQEAIHRWALWEWERLRGAALPPGIVAGALAPYQAEPRYQAEAGVSPVWLRACAPPPGWTNEDEAAHRAAWRKRAGYRG